MGSTDTWDDVMRLVKSKGNMAVDLKNAEKGKVVTRFPPEPSGFLHIGHAKAALLNDYFARQYEGELIVRFDDTNTEKATQGFEDAIITDLDRLGIKPNRVEYTSDYFPQLLEVATEFIKAGKAYVDPSSPEEVKEQRLKKQANQYRDQSIEENLKMWEEMIQGTELGEKCILRAKIDIRNNNGTLRDPTMYRTKKVPHHRKGTEFNVYPTYDFSCPLVDSWEGVTHALRSLEYKDREKQYIWFCKAAEIRCPAIWEFSRLDFVKTVLSKRKLQQLVDLGAAESWDDPRFPTIQGIRRRGMTIQGLRAFILSQGASRNNTTQEMDKIWTVNKRVIDPAAPRHVAIDRKNAKRVTVENIEHEVKVVPKHKKNPDVGTKHVIYQNNILIEGEDAQSFDVGEKVTFMDWGNMEITGRDDEGNLQAKYLPDDRNFKGTKKVTWLADVDDLVPLRLHKYSDLLTKDRLEKEDKFEDYINHNNEEIIDVCGDINLRLLKKGETIQLERRGYYICDSTALPLKLIEVPDGKVAKK